MSERRRVRREADAASIWGCLQLSNHGRRGDEPRTLRSRQSARQSILQGNRAGSGSVAVCRRRWQAARPRWDGGGRREAQSPFQEGSILGRRAPLSSASTLLFKGPLPLFLSLTNLVMPPSYTNADHSPVQRQGRGLRGVPRPRATCSPALHPSALQGRGRPGGLPDNPAVLLGRYEEGLQLGPVPCSPAGSEISSGVPSWSLTLQPYQARGYPCSLSPAALQGRHWGPQLSPARFSPARYRWARGSPTEPCTPPCRRALGPSCRKPLAQVLSRLGEKSTTTKGCANMALLELEPGHPERPGPERCLGLLALPGTLAFDSWVLLLASP